MVLTEDNFASISHAVEEGRTVYDNLRKAILFLWLSSQGVSEDVARTVAVNTMVMFEVFYLLNSRFITAPVLNRNGLLGSRPVLLAIALVIVFQLLFTYTPLMQGLFGTTAIGWRHWLWILMVSVNVLWIVELEKWAARRAGWG